MIDLSNTAGLGGATVVDSSGHRIGTVGRVYIDDVTDELNWMTIRSGPMRMFECLAPLTDSKWEAETIRMPFTKRFVKNAPRVAARPPTAEDGEILQRYYGMAVIGTASTRELVFQQ